MLSCEGAGQEDAIRLTTAGIAAVQLKVTGRASHAGGAPEQGRNALYELSHQILQTRDLSDPATGVKMNWTLANAGSARNVIPAEARATADVRVLRVADYDGIEQQVRERHQESVDPRYAGRDGVRAHPSAARSHARGAHRGGPCAAHLQRDRPSAPGPDHRARRRHRRRVRGAADESGRDRRVRPARVRRALERRRVHRDCLDRDRVSTSWSG